MNENEIGEAIERRRKTLGLTQDEVATLAATHRRTISALENAGGPRGVTLGTLLATAAVLGLEVDVRPKDD